MKKTSVSLITCSLLAVGFIGGCGQSDPYSFKSIRNDLSPELAGAADRPDDIDRHTAVMADINMRSYWDDFTRIFYIDHPSRLSPYPIVNTSGNPR